MIHKTQPPFRLHKVFREKLRSHYGRGFHGLQTMLNMRHRSKSNTLTIQQEMGSSVSKDSSTFYPVTAVSMVQKNNLNKEDNTTPRNNWSELIWQT